MINNRRFSRHFQRLIFSAGGLLLLLSHQLAFGNTWKMVGGCQDTDMGSKFVNLIGRSCTINTYTYDNLVIQQLVGTSTVSGTAMTMGVQIRCDGGAVMGITISVNQNIPALEHESRGIENNKFLVYTGMYIHNGCTNTYTDTMEAVPLFDMGDDSPVNPLTDDDSTPGEPDACESLE